MGCKCSLCWGFAEFAADELGSDYGLPRSPGHARPVVEPAAEVVRLRPRRVVQPWQARPSRFAA
jgi:hypothetical protein